MAGLALEVINLKAKSRANTSRSLAFRCLSLISNRRERSADVLSQYRPCCRNPAEKRLLTELVYGVLRWQNRLDYFINRLCDRPPDTLDPAVRLLLRIGLYQVHFLNRIPHHAAVNETIACAKELGFSRASSFLNGILRRFLRTPLSLPSRANELDYLTFTLSTPRWIAHRWREHLGFLTAEEILRQCNTPPPFTVRINTLRCAPDAFSAFLGQEGLRVFPSSELQEAAHLAGLVDLSNLKSFQEGLFYVQDKASQLIPHLLQPAPSWNVLDACAAPGGKTSHIAALMGNRGRILAIDTSQERLQRLRENLDRLGCRNARCIQGDMTRPPMRASFDGILLDAPCSGLGTIRRHPEIKWHRHAGEFPGLAQRQSRLLEAAASHLQEGGRLVYAVCSFEPEEGTEVVARFLKRHSHFSLVNPTPFLPDAFHCAVTPAGILLVLPHQFQSDGFLAAILTRDG